MNKYIDANRLKAEIERRRLSNRYIDTYDYETELFEIIDSLQQEQPEVDFENEFQEYWYLHQYDNRLRRLIANGHGKAVLKNVAIHFCVLGLNARK